MCKYRHWLRFVISLRIQFREWTAGKFPTYFSRDTKCLDHNMSMISCKLVHPFFFVQTSLFKRWSPIYQADIYHSSSISGSFLNTSKWAALERCLSCLFPDSIWVFSGFKTAFYFINTRYQIMMRCWKKDPDARPTLTDPRNQLKDTETFHKVESYWLLVVFRDQRLMELT